MEEGGIQKLKPGENMKKGTRGKVVRGGCGGQRCRLCRGEAGGTGSASTREFRSTLQSKVLEGLKFESG
jgi:hypothetical protein